MEAHQKQKIFDAIKLLLFLPDKNDQGQEHGGDEEKRNNTPEEGVSHVHGAGYVEQAVKIEQLEEDRGIEQKGGNSQKTGCEPLETGPEYNGKRDSRSSNSDF